MNKSIKLLAALLIIGTSFTACTKEETAPEPQTSIQDFEGAYKYVSTGRYFTMEVVERTTFEGVELVEIWFSTGVTLADLTRRDAKSFTCTRKNGSVSIGTGLLFIDPTGIRKFSGVSSIDGSTSQAVED